MATLELPDVVHRERIAGNTVFHVGEYGGSVGAAFGGEDGGRWTFRDSSGRRLLLFPPRVQASTGTEPFRLRVVGAAPDDPTALGPSTELRWLSHPSHGWTRDPAAINASWVDALAFRQEDMAAGRPGLREAQIGAIHAVVSHWTVKDRPATVVLPTGIGKTETMLSVLIHSRCPRVLVLVPSDVLRSQLHKKFCSLGRLRELQVIPNDTLSPRVALIRKGLRTPEEADALAVASNVLVATASVLDSSSKDALKRLAELCSHLFVDEAHHLPAHSWDKIATVFGDRPRLYFTATPFRRDGKYLEGEIIYNYPLARAQARGHFRPINYLPVEELIDEQADATIAKRAIAQLREDLAADLDHLILARVGAIDDADRVAEVYHAQAPDLAPVVIHSKLPSGDQTARVGQLKSRTSRVLVCVDMFGEGFDFPQLKIAAMHAIHKSLPITLQFVGRFTRSAEKVGDAAVVVNIADPRVDAELEALYEQDADWNELLRRKSAEQIDGEVSFQELIEGFEGALARQVPLWTLRPKRSTVAFKVENPQWKVGAFVKALPKHAGAWSASNRKAQVAICVFTRKEDVRWGRARDMKDLTWHLVIAHYASDLGLLFLHASDTDVIAATKLARALTGDPKVELLCGPKMFRVFHEVNRPMVKNLGTSKSGRVRFTMYFGSDVSAGLSQVDKAEAEISNVFGWGFREGEQVTYGCSTRKGKVWSFGGGRISDWIDWCREVGRKLADDGIDDVEITRGFLRPQELTERPALIPVAAQWGEGIARDDEERVEIYFGAVQHPLAEVALSVEHSAEGPIRLSIDGGGRSAVYELTIGSADGGGPRYRYARTSGGRVELRKGSGDRKPFEQWMQSDPVIIHYVDGSFSYNEFFVEAACPGDYNPELLRVVDWTGTDVAKESQGPNRDSTSIQHRVIADLMSDYDLIFDDDASNEAADVIALRREADGTLHLHFVHCKYTSEPRPGARVGEFYELCGQAQKCVSWKHAGLKALVSHMRSRDARWRTNLNKTRFVKGDMKTLRSFERLSRATKVSFEVTLIQPGLSKAAISNPVRKLLGTTDLYLRRTVDAQLNVVCSA